MQGINKLTFLTPEQKTLLVTSETNYKRYARIYFQVVSYEPDKEVIVKVWQEKNPTEKYLLAAELIERAKDVFAPLLPSGVALHIRPIEYRKILLQSLTIEDVCNFMEKHGLQQKDLVKLLNIDKSNLNRLITGERELTNIHRTMFFYFIQYYELNLKIKSHEK